MSSPRRVPALTLRRSRTAFNSVLLSTPRLLSFWIRGPKACRRFSKLITCNPQVVPTGRTALMLGASPLVHWIVETSISDPGRHYCRLADDDADGAVEATRLWPREPQVKRGRSGGLNRPAWSLPSSASLSRLKETNRAEARSPSPPFRRAPTLSLINDSHIQRWLCWSSTPTAHVQRFPHTQPLYDRCENI